MNKKQIVFVLPGREGAPIGGYKVVYQYADYLAKDFEVHVLRPIFGCGFVSASLFEKIKIIIRGIINRIKKNRGAEPSKQNIDSFWFHFNNPVIMDRIIRLNKKVFSQFNNDAILIATSVETAYDLAKYYKKEDKNKFYFIQDYELWGKKTEEYLDNSFNLGFNHIVISDWLKNIVMKKGFKSVVVSNGFDLNYFKLNNPIEKRDPYCVSMLYHTDDRKRCVDAFSALEIVKKAIPDLHVNIFGTSERPGFLPTWYNYFQKPDKDTHNYIYNSASVFVAASSFEGYGLPPAEAMLCGCALCCTETTGFLSYAKNNETALTSKVYDVNTLAHNIILLIKNSELRYKIAHAGHDLISTKSIEKSAERFKQVLLNYENFL